MVEDERVTALERILMARDIGVLERRMEDVRPDGDGARGERDRLIRRFSRSTTSSRPWRLRGQGRGETVRVVSRDRQRRARPARW